MNDPSDPPRNDLAGDGRSRKARDPLRELRLRAQGLESTARRRGPGACSAERSELALDAAEDRETMILRACGCREIRVFEIETRRFFEIVHTRDDVGLPNR